MVFVHKQSGDMVKKAFWTPPTPRIPPPLSRPKMYFFPIATFLPGSQEIGSLLFLRVTWTLFLTRVRPNGAKNIVLESYQFRLVHIGSTDGPSYKLDFGVRQWPCFVQHHFFYGWYTQFFFVPCHAHFFWYKKNRVSRGRRSKSIPLGSVDDK